MSLATDIAKIEYVREAATGNLVASFNGLPIKLVAVRSGLPRFENITSYNAFVDGYVCDAVGLSLNDAKTAAGLSLIDLFSEDFESPSCSPAGEPC